MKVSGLNVHRSHQDLLCFPANISNGVPSRISLAFTILCLLRQHYGCLNRAKEADVLNSHPTNYFQRKKNLCQNFKAQQLEISVSSFLVPFL